MRLLLDRGAKINANSGQCGNALQAALRGRHQDIVKLLKERGAKLITYE